VRRAVVSVATGKFLAGQRRLMHAVAKQETESHFYHGLLPEGCPPHSEVPYAFKAYALKEQAKDFDLLLWADACILPIRSLEPLWERIERDGYWMSNNGWSNYEWTATEAYRELFHEELRQTGPHRRIRDVGTARIVNHNIKHVVAGAFGLNVQHPKGKAFLDEYYRLASETRAFCGPTWNRWHPDYATREGAASCGPADVRGHRHDQTAASVIAWRLGFELTDPPTWFAYRGRETEETLLVADGGY
jgi:hypothetical protein